MNVFYLGVDNPVTITVENTSCKDLIIKTDNGSNTGNGCERIFHGNKVGVANIIVFKRVKV
ncbi:MAG: hypothetical protein WDM90_16260 [Ferruginibacter sp.]